MNEAKVQVIVTANAGPGTFPIVVNGKAKHNNKDFAASAPPANLVVTK